MRMIVSLLSIIILLGCRTTKEADKRTFAGGKGSNEGIQGVTVNPPPKPKPGVPLPTLPAAEDPLEKGVFYGTCMKRGQLPSREALTMKALLAATHQSECLGGERWLRDQRNKTLRIESEGLVELQSLRILQNYPHIQDVFIRIAEGVDAVCPLQLTQKCHFSKSEFETLSQ